MSDFGWGDTADNGGLRGLHTVTLLLASLGYAASVWLAHGLPPLPRFASRVRTSNRPDHDHTRLTVR